MRALVCLVILLGGERLAAACPDCRPLVERAIYDDTFLGRLGLAALPFALVALVVMAIAWAPAVGRPRRHEET